MGGPRGRCLNPRLMGRSAYVGTRAEARAYDPRPIPSWRPWRPWRATFPKASRKVRKGRKGERMESRKRTKGTQRARGDREVAVWNQGSWRALPARERGLKPAATVQVPSLRGDLGVRGVRRSPGSLTPRPQRAQRGSRWEAAKAHKEHREAGEARLRGKADGAVRCVLAALPPLHARHRPRATRATPAWSASRPPAMTIRRPFHHTPCKRDPARARPGLRRTRTFSFPLAPPRQNSCHEPPYPVGAAYFTIRFTGSRSASPPVPATLSARTHRRRRRGRNRFVQPGNAANPETSAAPPISTQA